MTLDPERDLAALNAALNALTNLQVAIDLVSDYLAALQRQTRRKILRFNSEGKFTGYAWDTTPDEFISDHFFCGDIEARCEWLPKYVDKLWESHDEVENALVALPSRLTDKLDSLTGSPWVASVRRHCLDKVLAWPGELQHQTSMAAEKVHGSIAELLDKAAKRDPFETWNKYLELISGYKHDVFAIRGEAENIERGPRPVTQPTATVTKQKAKRDKALEDRDRWIYDECCKGTAYDTISIRLKKKPKSWPRIESRQGVRNAAIRYATRHSLPPIPSRQDL